MKIYGLVLLSLCFLFSGCEDEEITDQEQQTCEKGIDCVERMDWNLVVSKSDFPARLRLAVDDQIILDECDGGLGEGRINRGVTLNTIEINSFFPLASDAKFKLSLIDLGSCYEANVYHEKDPQPFQIRDVRGEDKVWIEILN